MSLYTKTGTKDKFVKRWQAPKNVTQALPNVLQQVTKKRGFCSTDLLLNWPEIAGKWLGQKSQPIKIVFPASKRTNGTLHLYVAASLAPVLQHSTPQLIQRVNQYYGWAAVKNVKIYQRHVAI